MNLFFFGRSVTYGLVRLLFKMQYEGLEHLTRERGYILACNHASNFDPLFIAHSVKPQIFYFAKAELFCNPVLGWLMHSFGAIPVARGSGDTTAIESAESTIRTGGVLGFFPEGSRSKDGKLQRARSGVAVIAGRAGADVLPCCVYYEGKLRFRTRVTVRYGELITREELCIDVGSPASVRDGAKLVMARITALYEQCAQNALDAKSGES